jgi:hypothetical protein
MTDARSLQTEMRRIAAAAGSVERRADALLGCLRRAVPSAAAWIAVRDPETRLHTPVGSQGDVDALSRYFSSPDADEEVEALGLNRFQPPMPASALPTPLPETRAWGEYLLPAGFNDGVALGLFTDDGRHLGFLSLLTDDPANGFVPFLPLLASLRPSLAEALDRLPSFVAAAELSGDALAGVAMTRTGRCVRLLDMPTHPLLAEDSPALALARRPARAAGTVSVFLCPWGGSFLRVSVLDCRDDTIDHLRALVLVRPAGEIAADLGPSDVRLLGALVEGWDEDRIRAGVGLSDPSGSARALARRLGLPSVGALAQHVAREGLYLPSSLW